MIEQSLSHQVIDDQNPWPGLTPFDEAAQSFFSGRDAESAEVVRLVGLAPLTVLYGKSGLGKTSLLLAGAFPRLRLLNFLPIHLRLDTRDQSAPLIAQVVSALRIEIGKYCSADTAVPSDDQSLWEYLHGRVQWWSKKNQPLTPLLVFDQFEEAFTLGAENPEAIERLRIDLADLIENRIPLELGLQIEKGAKAEQLDLRGQRYKVLLSFREDFLPEVEGWKESLPSLMRNRLRLQAMTADHALQVVSGVTPAGRTHTLVGEETARKIIEFVAAVQTGKGKDGGESRKIHGEGAGKVAEIGWENMEIEPALLSLVCSGLNKKRKSRGLPTIEKEMVDEAGTAIIADFYQDCIAMVPEKPRHFVQDFLITEGGFRNSYPLQDAYEQGFLTEALLRQLVDCRLLRIEHQGGVERVELMHDRLTDVVREHRDRERELADERARSHKRWWWLVVTGFIVLVLVIFGGVVLKFWQDSKKALRRAVAGKLVMQSRAILEGNKAGNPDTALLLAAAGFELHRDGNAYGALQYALQALPWPGMKIVSFPDMVKAISQDGSVVATLSNQNLILREVATGKSLGGAELQQKSEISAVAFSSDCRTLASGSARGQVQLWDVETGKQRGRPIEQHDEDVTSLAFSPDGSTLASGGTDRAVRLWDASTGKQRGAPLQGHSGRIVSVAFSPDGRTLASASSDKTVRFWNVTTGKPRGTPLQGHTESVAIVIFSPDGRTLASGSSDKTVRLWDVASGKPRGTPLKGHENAVCSLAFSLDARTLASGSADNTVRLWDIGTGKQRGAPLKGHSAPVLRLAFSWDGRTLASGTGDENVRLWDVSNETSLRGRGGADLRGHTSPVQSVAFSPDGRTLASGSDDETVRLWDLASGKQRGAPLLEHSGVVFSVAFSPDGKTLASGRSDGTVRLWDVATGKQRGAPLRGHTNSVTSVAFSPTAGPWLPGVGTGRYGCGTWQPASFGEFRCRGKTKGYQAKGYQAWRITSTARPWRPGVRMGPCGSGT